MGSLVRDQLGNGALQRGGGISRPTLQTCLHEQTSDMVEELQTFAPTAAKTDGMWLGNVLVTVDDVRNEPEESCLLI